MQKKALVLTIILNLISTIIWGENFEINYYHKGVSVHTQQVIQGEAIGTFPELNLVSCNDEINLFAGWIAEDDVTKYQTSNTATPTFITEEYVPTTNINLYALFADKEDINNKEWLCVTNASQLKDGDQIIITTQSATYAMSKTLENDKFLSIAITCNEDKSKIYPTSDNIEILTIKTTEINSYFSLFNGTEYICSQSSTNNTINKSSVLNTNCYWEFSISNQLARIRNYNTSYAEYLYYNDISKYFACRKTSISNLAIYKQTTGTTINYIACTTPDAVEYTITLHDGDNTSEIKCMSDASIAQPASTQIAKHWEFYGWATAPSNGTTTTPEIISFPYTPTNDIDLYAVYSNTTADSLIMSNKTIPANWQVKETRAYNTVISLFNIIQNQISIPKIENITSIEIEMMYTNRNIERTLYITNQAGKELFRQEAYWEYKTYMLSFNKPTSTELIFKSSSSNTKDGIAIRKITIYHQLVYSSKIEEDIRDTISFYSQSATDQIKHYSISQSHGKSVKLPKNTFTNDLDFACWNTSPDGYGTQYADEATIDNITNNITLYAEWGRIETIESLETLSIEENSTIKRLTIKSDVNGNTGEIKIANNSLLSINHIVFEKEIDNLRYHFFSLPFDCNITDIKAINDNGEYLTYAPNATDGDWVICRYDQTLAANNAGNSTTNAWVDILDQNYTLKANQGYIVGQFCDYEKVTVRFTSKEDRNITAPQNKTFDFGPDYQWYTKGENLSANGWNLIGSPYYETITNGELTQFVTIPNTDGKTYTQCLYSEALKQELITPFSSFFVQLNENDTPSIITTSPKYILPNNYTSNIITLTITGDTNQSDKTTIINHGECNAEYEIGYDLIKWIGYADRPQIYTIENETFLAFNSQKIDETTTLSLGIYSPSEGEYTFSANENCPNILLFDKETKTTVNLAQSDYTTHLSSGTNNNRFEISFQKTTSTHLPLHNAKIEYFIKHDIVYITNLPQNAIIYIYDCTGKMIDIATSDYFTLPSKGLYHIIIIENNIKIDNFYVIY